MPVSSGAIPRSDAGYFALSGKVPKTLPKPRRFRTSGLVRRVVHRVSASYLHQAGRKFADGTIELHFACRPVDHRTPDLWVVVADRARSEPRCVTNLRQALHRKGDILADIHVAGERGKRSAFLGGGAGNQRIRNRARWREG